MRNSLDKELVSIGKIVDTFGYKGMVKVLPLTDFPERFKKLHKVKLVHNDKILDMEVETTKPHNNVFLFKFKGIESKEEAVKYKSGFIKVPEEETYALPEGYYYHFQLKGMDVHDEKRGYLGKLTDIIETGANDVYVVKSEKYGEILIPAIKQVIKSVNVENKLMQVELLEGLIDE